MGDGTAMNTISISSKSHLNLTFNLNQCGDAVVPPGGVLNVAADDSFMLALMGSGTAWLAVGDLGYPMQGTQGFFSFPDMGCEFHNRGEETVRILWLRFSGYLVENYLNRANISRTCPVFEDGKREIFSRMETLYKVSQRLPNRYCHMMSALYDIFARLLDREHARARIHYIDDANYYAVKAAEYIERHYTMPVSVDEIAQAAGVSRKHLYAVFREIMRISPKQYLIYYRIEKAGHKLRMSTQSIQQIAEEAGYSNQFYFAREFKRLTGMTPSEYRKNPGAGDVLSYRVFQPALQARRKDRSMDRPIQEEILTVYAEPVQSMEPKKKR